MMTQTTPTQETARQILGKALRFFREQRRMPQRALADRVGCSIGDIDDWERGKSAPPDHRWGRLCKMLHDDLAGMRATWQRARAEDEREKAEKAQQVQPTGHLTTKPFANIGALVKEAERPAPVLSIVPAPVPVPETLHDDGFDLRPAYKAVANLPDGWRTAEAAAERRAYARELLLRGMSNDEIYKQVRLKFGVGIGPQILTELRTEIREARAREHRQATGRPEPIAAMAEEVRAPLPPPKVEAKPEPPPPPKPPTTENNIEGAVRLILEAIPNLKSFKLEVSDSGEIDVSHTTREVKVVETTGSLKLKK